MLLPYFFLFFSFFLFPFFIYLLFFRFSLFCRTPQTGASFEGDWGAVAPPPPQGKWKKEKRKKKERKKEKKRRKKERKKGTMNNVKVLHIKCCFSNFSKVGWHWKIKKLFAPKKKLKWRYCPQSAARAEFPPLPPSVRHCFVLNSPQRVYSPSTVCPKLNLLTFQGHRRSNWLCHAIRDQLLTISVL